MIVAVADTHAILWYLNKDDRLSETARSFMDKIAETEDQIAVASITLVELFYLVEKKRITPEQRNFVVEILRQSLGLFSLYALDYDSAIAVGNIPREQVPDMPDRIIAAAAWELGVPIITRDRKIQAAELTVIW